MSSWDVRVAVCVISILRNMLSKQRSPMRTLEDSYPSTRRAKFEWSERLTQYFACGFVTHASNPSKTVAVDLQLLGLGANLLPISGSSQSKDEGWDVYPQPRTLRSQLKSDLNHFTNLSPDVYEEWRKIRSQRIKEWYKYSAALRIYLDERDLAHKKELDAQEEEVKARLISNGWPAEDIEPSQANLSKWKKITRSHGLLENSNWSLAYPELLDILKMSSDDTQNGGWKARYDDRVTLLHVVAGDIEKSLPLLHRVAIRSGSDSDLVIPERFPLARDSLAAYQDPRTRNGDTILPFPSKSELLEDPTIKELLARDLDIEGFISLLKESRTLVRRVIEEWRLAIELELVGILALESSEFQDNWLHFTDEDQKIRAPNPRDFFYDQTDSLGDDNTIPKVTVLYPRPDGSSTTDVSYLPLTTQILLRADSWFICNGESVSYPKMSTRSGPGSVWFSSWRVKTASRWQRADRIMPDRRGSSISRRILEVLGRPDATHAELMSTGSIFKCGRCGDPPTSWEIMVGHYRKELDRWEHAQAARNEGLSSLVYNNPHHLTEEPGSPLVYLVTPGEAQGWTVYPNLCTLRSQLDEIKRHLPSPGSRGYNTVRVREWRKARLLKMKAWTKHLWGNNLSNFRVKRRLKPAGWTHEEMTPSPANWNRWRQITRTPHLFDSSSQYFRHSTHKSIYSIVADWDIIKPSILKILQSNRLYYREDNWKARQHQQIDLLYQLGNDVRDSLPLLHRVIIQPGSDHTSVIPDQLPPAEHRWSGDENRLVRDTVQTFPSMAEFLELPSVRNLLARDLSFTDLVTVFETCEDEVGRAIQERRIAIEQELVTILDSASKGYNGDSADGSEDPDEQPIMVLKARKYINIRPVGPLDDTTIPKSTIVFPRPDGTCTTNISTLPWTTQTLLRADSRFIWRDLSVCYPLMCLPDASLPAFFARDEDSYGTRWNADPILADRRGSIICRQLLSALGRPDATHAELVIIGNNFKCGRCGDPPTIWEVMVGHYRTEQDRWRKAKSAQQKRRSSIVYNNVHEFSPTSDKPLVYMVSPREAHQSLGLHYSQGVDRRFCDLCTSLGLEHESYRFAQGDINCGLLRHLREV
ncbi:DNA mismatch repair protein MutS [Ceratobasidium sp. AG-Ba]|nr:DNA mismatch repair protein MutS [Ceratobasidium sp. AG-Ba]